MLPETHVQATAVYASELANRRMQGSGHVRNVGFGAGSSEYVVVVDCGNDVLLQIRSVSAGLRDLKIGARVSFSGTITGWRRESYRNASRAYVMIFLEEAAVESP
jgi:hypothetical protein